MNALSMLGRMSYGAHMVTTTLILGGGYQGYSMYSAKSKADADKEVQDNLPKLMKVDPDVFHPFSPIPFHNNPELKYRYANMKLHGYVDAKSHLNLKDYAYKGYHD